MCFPLSLPACCRVSGKRKREVRGPLVWFGASRIAAVRTGRGRREQWSAADEAVTVGGFDDEAGGRHGGPALVEGGCADTTGCAQCGERPGLLAVGEGRGDALIDGSWFDTALDLDGSRARVSSRSVVQG
jgi:hypothetical protein